MKFAEYVYKRLQEIGCDYAFGIPGSYIAPIWQSFKESAKLILARHESGAAFMANGWTRITGKLSVVLSTLGPGITNVITGTACAFKDSLPLLVITGQAPVESFGKGVFQECYPTDRGFSPNGIMSHVTKASIEINNIKNAVHLFEQAIKIATSGRKGPVHISIALDVQNQDVTEEQDLRYKNVSTVLRYDIEKVIDRFYSAERPLIIAGWGCHLSGCSKQLEMLSSKWGAPILSTVKGLTACSYKWEMFLGHVGPGQNKEILDFLYSYKPDLILVLGASLASYYSSHIKPIIDQSYCIQVDIDAEQLGFYQRIDCCIQADLREWLTSVCNSFKYHKNCRDIKEKILQFKSELLQTYSQLASKTGLMAKSINMLNRILPENAIVIPDAGNHWLDTLSLYRTQQANGFFIDIGIGSMGHAIGSSIGIKLADPNKRVVCITGDGSILMSGSEISVSTELNLNNIYIIYNNASHGRVRTDQYITWNEDYIASDIIMCDFCKWGESLGAQGFRVASENEFKEAVASALEIESTSVIEVLVDKNEIPVCLLEGLN